MKKLEVSKTETIIPGLDLQWYLEDRIVKYILSNVTTQLLDTWSETVLKLLQNWSDSQPYLAVHDLSDRGVGMSYATQVRFDMLNLAIRQTALDKAEKILSERKQMPNRVALLFNSFHSGYMGQLFARRSGSSLSANVEYEVFYDPDSALAWLQEVLPDKEEKEE